MDPKPIRLNFNSGYLLFIYLLYTCLIIHVVMCLHTFSLVKMDTAKCLMNLPYHIPLLSYPRLLKRIDFSPLFLSGHIVFGNSCS